MSEELARANQSLSEQLKRRTEALELSESQLKGANEKIESLKLALEKVQSEKEVVHDSVKAEFDHIYGGLRGDLGQALKQKDDILRATEIARLETERQLVEKAETCDGLVQIVKEKEEADEAWKEEIERKNEELQRQLGVLEADNRKVEETVSNLERMLRESTNEVDRGKVEIQELNSSKLDLEARVHSIEQDNKSLEEAAQELKEKMTSSFDEVEELNALVKELKIGNEELEGGIQSLTMDNNRLEEQSKALEEKNNQLMNDCDKLKAELETLKIDKEEIRSALEEDLEHVRTEKRQICQKLRDDFERTILDKDEILSNLKAKLLEIREERNEAVGKATKEVTELREEYELKLRDLQDMLEKAQVEKEEMFERLMKDAEDGKVELSTGLKREFEVLLTEKDESVQNIQISLDQLRQNLGQAEKEREELTTALLLARNEVSDLHGLVAELQQELEERTRRHEDDLQRLEAERDDLVKAHEREVEKLAQEYSDIQQKLEERLVVQQARVTELEAAVRQAEEQLHQSDKVLRLCCPPT